MTGALELFLRGVPRCRHLYLREKYRRETEDYAIYCRDCAFVVSWISRRSVLDNMRRAT